MTRNDQKRPEMTRNDRKWLREKIGNAYERPQMAWEKIVYATYLFKMHCAHSNTDKHNW